MLKRDQGLLAWREREQGFLTNICIMKRYLVTINAAGLTLSLP
jgi:hypothetical protein